MSSHAVQIAAILAFGFSGFTAIAVFSVRDVRREERKRGDLERDDDQQPPLEAREAA